MIYQEASNFKKYNYYILSGIKDRILVLRYDGLCVSKIDMMALATSRSQKLNQQIVNAFVTHMCHKFSHSVL